MSLGTCALWWTIRPSPPPSASPPARGKATAPSTPVQPGEQQVTANVTAVYELVATAPASRKSAEGRGPVQGTPAKSYETRHVTVPALALSASLP